MKQKTRYRWRDLNVVREPELEGPDDPMRALLRQLFDRVPVGLFVLDNESGRFVLVNREFERITGYRDQESLQLLFTDLVAPEDLERIKEFRRRRMRGDTTLPRTYEMLIRTRSGERRVVLFHANPMDFEDAVTGAVMDVTGEKLRADPLLHVQRLDGLAALAGGLAGEFNNLLAAIGGYAALALARLPAESEAARAVRHIEGATTRALAQVSALLSFAQSGSNALASVAIDEIVTAVQAVLPAAAPGSYRFTASLGDNLGVVRGDASQLEQAILNVLTNATEAVPETGGRIVLTAHTITLQADDIEGLLPGTYVAIDIEDNGTGIPENMRDRIWQPFFSTRDNQRHPGLGLSTAYGIARDHGGALVLRESRRSGAHFTFYLPRELDVSRSVPAPLNDPDPARTADASVMVVDDQEYVAELFDDLLSEAGYRVQRETSALHALERLQQSNTPPDLFIVDLMMPDLDGRSFIRRVRGRGILSPILITSGYAPPDQDDAELSTMTQGFLRKPFTKADLLAQVRQCLRQHSPNVPAEEVP